MKIGRVVEEADESVYWLELIQAAAIIPEPTLSPVLTEAIELWRIFNQSQLTAKANDAARRAGHAAGHRAIRPTKAANP